MILLDVNVVLAAHRDDHPFFDRIRPWFDELTSGSDPFGAPLPVWWSFLRLATHPRIFEEPTRPADAFAFVEAVRAQPNHVDLGPGDGHLEHLRIVLDGAGAMGDLVPDGVLAALAREHGCTVASMDGDFDRLGVRWHNPLP
jgi:toxin-antitoxin system PIN domain toxin